MGLQHRAYNIFRSRPFYVGVLCGLAGVLVDTDHFIGYYFPQTPYHQWFPSPQLYPWVSPLALRPLHPQLLIISSLIILCMVSYIAGLYIKLVLRRKS